MVVQVAKQTPYMMGLPMADDGKQDSLPHLAHSGALRLRARPFGPAIRIKQRRPGIKSEISPSLIHSAPCDRSCHAKYQGTSCASAPGVVSQK